MAKYTKAEKEEELARLRRWFPKGSTVYTILRSRSRSGMSRDIGIVCLTKGDPTKGEAAPMYFLHPNFAVSVVLGYPLKRDAIRVGGAGMDMGFHVAFSLGRALYGDDYALKHEWL